jgi:hypothetical protein
VLHHVIPVLTTSFVSQLSCRKLTIIVKSMLSGCSGKLKMISLNWDALFCKEKIMMGPHSSSPCLGKSCGSVLRETALFRLAKELLMTPILGEIEKRRDSQDWLSCCKRLVGCSRRVGEFESLVLLAVRSPLHHFPRDSLASHPIAS